MAISMSNLVFNNYYYLTLTYSFYNVLANTPCDLRHDVIPSKLKSKDIFSIAKPTITAMNQPLLEENVSTTVNLSLSINELNIIDIKSLDVEIDLGMTQKWYDHRLRPDYKTRKLAVLGAIWKPKITFVVGNECGPARKNIPVAVASENYDQTQFWRGTSNGSVFYSERFFVKPKCTKDLTKYPFDSQTCFLKIGSYRFTAEEVILKWDITEKPIELRVGKEFGEFRLEKLDTYDEIDTRSSGNFSVLVLRIYFSRYSRREIIQSFMPSVVLLKMAYGAFWIKLSEIRTRIITCQFSLLGTLFLFANTNNCNILTNLTYLKALDIWFMICLIFALLPLAESILILRYFNPVVKENFKNEDTECESAGDEFDTKSSKNIAIRIDKILRLLHPIGLLSSTILFIAVFKNDGNYD